MRKAPKANGLKEGSSSPKLSRTVTMPDINTEKVCFIIVKARELESEDEGVEADASNAADDKFVSVMTEEAFFTVRAELKAYIDAMD
jgi:hypothetical protein